MTAEKLSGTLLDFMKNKAESFAQIFIDTITSPV
jgi:hypothetical protein